MNEILKFYEEHSISPVHQDITDFSRHMRRRENLYRQLGMPTILFKDKDVLEVGPGGGYNALTIAKWGGRLSLCEPNECGRKEIIDNFLTYGITDYDLYDVCLEDLEKERRYDAVIAEGFLPTIENWNDVFASLKDLVKEGGILVITCQDEMGMFVERMKRLFGIILTDNVNEFDMKVQILSDLYKTGLRNLAASTRPIKDWVQDQLLCNDFNCKNILSVDKAIEIIGADWDVLGMSGPNMLIDYSWYKDINYNYKNKMIETYIKNRYDLILAGREHIYIDENTSKEIYRIVLDIKNLEIEYETYHSENILHNIIERLRRLEQITEEFDQKITQFIRETVFLFENEREIKTTPKCETFLNSFGRSQQYLSFIRNS